MSARRKPRIRFLLQALVIAPVTLHYLISLPVGSFVLLWQPWTTEKGIPFFSLWILGSLLLGGIGLYALWVSIAKEGVELPRSRRTALGLGLIAGAIVALAWLALPFTTASEASLAGRVGSLLEFGGPLAVAIRQGAMLSRGRPKPSPRGGAVRA